uniref:Uncharacterized protein n=1 Tax=Tanacetum cinerariifolium TaxID=118510 RepID=A0A6L2J6V8_TANCI|nr:hypothetical protein [Tanacetum cinerariifolium]
MASVGSRHHHALYTTGSNIKSNALFGAADLFVAAVNGVCHWWLAGDAGHFNVTDDDICVSKPYLGGAATRLQPWLIKRYTARCRRCLRSRRSRCAALVIVYLMALHVRIGYVFITCWIRNTVNGHPYLGSLSTLRLEFEMYEGEMMI